MHFARLGYTAWMVPGSERDSFSLLYLPLMCTNYITSERKLHCIQAVDEGRPGFIRHIYRRVLHKDESVLRMYYISLQ